MSAFATATVNTKKYVFLGYLEKLLERLANEGDKKAEEFLKVIGQKEFNHVRMQGFRDKDEEELDGKADEYKIRTPDDNLRDQAIANVEVLISQTFNAGGGVPRESETGLDLQYFADKLLYSKENLTSIKFTLLELNES